MPESAAPFEIAGIRVPPGTAQRFELPAALLPTQTQLGLPLSVVHAERPGPKLFVSAAVHGDELNGVQVIADVLAALDGKLKRGTLVAAPIVNVFGFIAQTRDLPDGRDLNRSFPGSRKGSLASRVAHLFLDEVVARCDLGIDLHTAGDGRSNLPQTRGDFSNPELLRLARWFGAPAAVNSTLRKGSLREAAQRLGKPVLLYEGGEPLRFNEQAVRVGTHGVLAVLHRLGMCGAQGGSRRKPSAYVSDSSWVRAKRGGLLRLAVDEGQRVQEGQSLGQITDPLGTKRSAIAAPFDGLVIGKTINPVIHAGEALVHLGRVEDWPSGQ